MNRHQRRAQAAKKEGFFADCKGCGKNCKIGLLPNRVRTIYVGDPTAPRDLAICKGCPCATGKCDACGETGCHWLGCSVVGLAEMPATGAMLQ